MKGGYQIINLSNTTAGDPATVPGIYDMAKENHGKSVMLYTPDAQRVFAQIKKVVGSGSYKTTYLSAEGNVVIVEIASNDAVTTTITNPTSSIVGLEVAVNDLSETKAARADISDLKIDASYNDTGETIATGRYFYLNGALCKAKVDIANNATFTLNTNFTVVTIDEELSALNSNLSNLIKTYIFTSDANGTVSILFNRSNALLEIRVIGDYESWGSGHNYSCAFYSDTLVITSLLPNTNYLIKYIEA